MKLRLTAWITALLLLCSAIIPATTVFAAQSTTANHEQLVKAYEKSQRKERASVTAVDNQKGSSNMWHQVVMVVGIALIIGVLAGVYGIIHMAESKSRKNEVQLNIQKGRKQK